MRWLIWLYPREWRERYGEEFEALLATRPHRPAEWLDILRGALDARHQRYPSSLDPSDRPTRRKEKRTMFIKAAAIAFTIATTAAGAFFGLTMSVGHHAQPVVASQTLAEGGEPTGPTVTVAVTKQLPTTPSAGDMAFTRTGEAIAFTKQTSTPALRHVPARTSVYLTIRFGFPPDASFICTTPPCMFRVGTTYIVRLAGYTILRAVYPSHAFLGLPPPSMLVVFSKQYTFSHPGVYRFVGRVSIDGVTGQASIRVHVTA